jgi:hypothetical protein
MLRDYLLKIKAVDDDTCPECQSAPQSVLHLFLCLAFPTTLTPIDLWYHPVDAVQFIVNLPAFRSLPPLDIPLPDLPLNPTHEFERLATTTTTISNEDTKV